MYRIQPNDVGDPGDLSEIVWEKGKSPLVQKLHVEVRFPITEDLMEGFFSHVVTNEFRHAVQRNHLSGVSFEACVATPHPELEEDPESTPISELCRMVVTGKPFEDDFGVTEKFRLIVSERVIDLLNSVRYNHCKTEVLEGGDAAEAKIAHRRRSAV